MSVFNTKIKKFILMRQPGIEPGSHAWKACMLTIIPLTLVVLIVKFKIIIKLLVVGLFGFDFKIKNLL